jgi:hypothetical protein
VITSVRDRARQGRRTDDLTLSICRAARSSAEFWVAKHGLVTMQVAARISYASMLRKILACAKDPLLGHARVGRELWPNRVGWIDTKCGCSNVVFPVADRYTFLHV